MLPQGSDPNLVVYQGRMKGYHRGIKYYRPFIRYLKQARGLKRTFRTATRAELYGLFVVARYRRLCTHAATKVVTKVQQG